MSVPEQIPYVGYVANGQTTEFPITFDLHDPEYLIVTVNKEIPVVGTYTVDMNALKVVFATAPADGTQVELYRETELNRDTNYQKYDNSFRAEAVNYDFDKIWHVIQEQDMIDAELLARLKTEIEWRRTHDANFDELAKMRDAQIFSGLKQYLDTILAASNPNIFDGITAGIVFALDKKSVQTHLENIYAELVKNTEAIEEEILRATESETTIDTKINLEVIRATAAEAVLDGKINANGVGNRAYKTYALMDADKANIPPNSKVTVTNDATTTNNGDWQWDGAAFTKSAYDPLTQAKNYTNSEVVKTETSTLSIVDLKMEGGDLALVTGASFSFDGYINATGGFVASGAGYKATDYIYVEAGKPIKFSLNAGSTVSVVAFYDANKSYISSVVGNSSNIERSTNIPANAYYVRISNLPTNQPSPYCKVSYVSAVISENDLTLKESQNLADPALIVSDSYVNSTGGITAGAGWKHIKIPVVPGETYTLGNFVIDTRGYFTFQTAGGGQIAGEFGSYESGTLPRTVIAPANAGFLLFDIARPSNTPDQYAQLMCNVGNTLLPYEEPEATISKIKNYKISGTGGGGGPLPDDVVTEGSSPTLGNVTADEFIGALKMPLPNSPVGLQIGDWYRDENGFVKVVV
ncbi:phage tail fiber protein [Acinetobacter baumannii]|uniref:phage tail fiber domain-containing protein n=1 Tax=Acinetobacter baumannii TaxID=470 RepID=UPI003AF8BD04